LEILISVIIPTLNSATTIQRCINSLTNQTFPREKYEIIVVDGCSQDNSVKIAKQTGVDNIIIEKCTLGASRNIGAKNANGKILAFIDSDCEANDMWLECISKELVLKDAITGPLLNGTRGLISWAEYFLKFSDFNEHKKESKVKFLMGGNQACKREIYKKTGGFQDKLASEDVLFGKLLYDAGVDSYFIPKMQISHLGGATNLENFLPRMDIEGKYTVRNSREVLSIYSSLTTSKWKIPAVFIVKFGARLIRSIRAKKFGLFVICLPLIFLGIGSFCKGIWKELS